MRIVANILILAFAAIAIYMGYVAYVNDKCYFLLEQSKELICLVTISIMAYALKWRTAYILSVILSILSLGELIDEISGKNTSTLNNDYLILIIAAIAAIYLLLSRWLKSKKNS